jgi:hypothetical protein
MLEELKSFLGIIGNVTHVDNKLNQLLKSGEQFIIETCDGSIIFETDERSKTLLFEYCRYGLNDMLELFKENFQGEIFSLSLRGGVNEEATES